MSTQTRSRRKPEVVIEPLVFNVDQTCARLNIGRSKYYQEVKDGELETFMIGDRRMTTDEQQRRYLERKQRQSL
jgi:hypothetical protein